MSEELTLEEFWYGCREAAHWFCPYLLGVENGQLHDDLHFMLDESKDCYVELPRGHGKTSNMAARVAWEIGRNPELRVKIVASTDDEAAKVRIFELRYSPMRSARCAAPSCALKAASRINRSSSKGTPAFFAVPRAVGVIICIRPLAPAVERAFGAKALSWRAMA